MAGSAASREETIAAGGPWHGRDGWDLVEFEFDEDSGLGKFKYERPLDQVEAHVIPWYWRDPENPNVELAEVTRRQWHRRWDRDPDPWMRMREGDES